MVFLLVGEMPEVADGEKGRSSLDHALEPEREKGQAAGADRLHQGDSTFPQDVDESQAQQPVHPPAQRALLAGWGGRGDLLQVHAAL
jgi:hypothetical protein